MKISNLKFSPVLGVWIGTVTVVVEDPITQPKTDRMAMAYYIGALSSMLLGALIFCATF